MPALTAPIVATKMHVEGCAVVLKKFDMTADQRRDAVARLMAYPLPFVEFRLLQEGHMPADLVPTAILEWRRFMATILFANGPVGMVSSTVDEVWHAHILFTTEYRAFCTGVFGQFIGHAPNWPGAPLSPGSGELFVTTYQRLFGVLPAIWTDPSVAVTNVYQTEDCSNGICEPDKPSENCNTQ